MLSYALTLTVITLLVAGLFASASGFVEDQQERTIRAELEVLGNRIGADLAAVDRLALVDGTTTAQLTTSLPSSVAGTSYRVAFVVEGDGSYDVVLSTSTPEVTVTVSVKLAGTLLEDTVSGGDIEIAFDGGDIEVANV